MQPALSIRRTAGRFAVAFVAMLCVTVAALLVVGHPAGAQHAAALPDVLTLNLTSLGALGVAGMIFQAVMPDDLATIPGLEAVPSTIDDTVTYTSGATVSANFWNVQRNDLSLSNVIGTGQMPANTWFIPDWMGLDILSAATVSGGNTAVGLLNDIQQLVMSGLGYLNFKLNGKPIWDALRLSFLHSSGGAVGAVGATLTAPNVVQVGTNGPPDGGFPILKSFRIEPGVVFSGQFIWPAALTLTATLKLRWWFAGTLVRPVS